MKTPKYIIIMLTLLCFATSQARDIYHLQFRFIASGDNVSGVVGIEEDYEGFLWIVYANNLCRYDGYSLKSYNPKMQQYEQYPLYKAIRKNHNNQIFVATSKAIYLYNKQIDSFTKVCDVSFIRNIFIDTDNNIWVYGNEAGFINYQTFNYTPFTVDDIPLKAKICVSNRSGVYLFPDNRCIRYGNGEQLTVYPVIIPSSNSVITDMASNDSCLYILTERDGVFKWKEGETPSICYKPIDDKQSVVARHLFIDSKGLFWIGTMQGLFIFNPKTNEDVHYTHTTSPSSIPDNSIWKIYEDHAHNMWIGTNAGGVCMLPNIDQRPFKTCSLSDFGYASTIVTTFAEQNDKIWFGTEGNGLFLYQKEKGILAHYVHQDGKNSVSANNIKCLCLRGENLWISTYLGGLDCLNTRTGIFTNYNKDVGGLYSNEVETIFPSKDGLWISYQASRNVTSYFSFATGIITHYDLSLSNYPHDDNNQYYFSTIGDSCLWMATRSNIITWPNISSDQLSSRIEPNLRFAISLDQITKNQSYITSIFWQSSVQTLWIGANESTLYGYTPTTKTFHKFSLAQYGPIQIRSIINDNQGNLWIGSNRGLFSIDNAKLISNYDKSDGIYSNICQSKAIYKDSKGNIYIGHYGGFTTIEPKLIMRNIEQPQTLIADLHINDQSIYDVQGDFFGKVENVAKNLLILNWNERNIAIELSSNNYLSPEKNHYRYRIIKKQLFAKKYVEWRQVDANNRKISLYQLPVGHYTLEATCCNNDGVWGNETKLKIIVKPIFWASIGAFSIYALILILIITYFVLTIRHNRKLKNEIYLATQRKKDEEKVNQSKVRFFVDVNRELKTPLTKLLANANTQDAASITELMQTMDEYTDKYCIDTSGEKRRKTIDTQLDRFTQMISTRIIDGHIDIDKLAQDMGMSRRRLFDFIKEHTGKSIVEYIRSYRIATAAKYMIEDNLSIKEAMYKVGMESQSYFIKCFEKEYGETPASFVAKMSRSTAKINEHNTTEKKNFVLPKEIY